MFDRPIRERNGEFCYGFRDGFRGPDGQLTLARRTRVERFKRARGGDFRARITAVRLELITPLGILA